MSNLAYAQPLRAPQRPAQTPRRAPHLVPVPAPAPRPRRRPRLVYASVVVLGMVAISLGQLMLSIVLGNGAYEISALKSDSIHLQRTANLISEDITVLSSPQNLAANAKLFGMVNNTPPAFLQLSDGEVLGHARTAGGAGGTLSSKIGLVPNALLSSITVGEAAKTANGSIASVETNAVSASSAEASGTSGTSGSSDTAASAGNGNTPTGGDLAGPSTH